MKKFIDRLMEKVELSKSESDFTFFFNLLVAGEAITKIVTLILTATLKKDIDRHQYRILHGLVRASGIGDWSRAIDDLIIGTASQHIFESMRSYQTEISKKTDKEEWQFQAVSELVLAMEKLNIKSVQTTGKQDLKNWFKLFTEIRNKTRGHGATLTTSASNAAIHLEKSITIIINNLSLLKIPSAYLKRNLSGKYRVTSISDINEEMEALKSSDQYNYEEGIYVYADRLVKLELIKSDPDLADFYISNGGFNTSKYEMISYITDDKIYEASEDYLAPKGQLPPSESEGLGSLRVYENCFSNAPNLTYEYIQRKSLEDELHDLLVNDRHIVITLLGRGGIGKTSLALKVIPRLYEEKRFDAVIWFSSRDIDLTTNGAKLVSADVINQKDIAKYYSKLLMSKDKYEDKNFDPINYFQTQLTSSDAGSTLFIFDNFETIDNPIETYKWVDTYIRHPNKILITTRLRDFKGDYPLQVQGMSHSESMELINITEKNLNIEGELTLENKEKIYNISAGHPYIIKILIGDFSKNKMKGSLEKLIAGSDEILTALFERTYSALNPCAQRVFLTLSSWNSAVPRLGLQSVLMHTIEDPLEVEKAIDTLVQYSMVEELKASDGYYFLQLPYVAFSFGTKKLKISPLQHLTLLDVNMIRRFGVSQLDDKNISLRRNLTKYLASISHNDDFFRIHKPILEIICLSYNEGWKQLAMWALESSNKKFWQEANYFITRYLENEKSDKNKYLAWNIFASISERLEKPYEQILGLTKASTYQDITLNELSNYTNKINQIFKSHEFDLGEDIKNELLDELFRVIYNRRDEADANTCSRFAWLALHLNKEEEAEALVQLGLIKDPENQYCIKLNKKFQSF